MADTFVAYFYGKTHKSAAQRVQDLKRIYHKCKVLIDINIPRATEPRRSLVMANSDPRNRIVYQ